MGPGHFSTYPFIPAPEYTSGARVADLDHDGVAEVVANGFYATWVLRSQGNGTYERVAELEGLNSLSLADVDGDGFVDLVGLAIQGFPAPLLVFMGGPSFQFSRVEVPLPGYSNQVLVGDVDGDQALDMVVAEPPPGDGSNNVHILRNLGNRTFAITQHLAAEGTLELRDLNGDGKADLVAGTPSALVVRLAPELQPVVNAVAGGAGRFCLGDFNGDARDDAVVLPPAEGGAFTVLLNNGAGGFPEPGASYAAELLVSACSAVDLDQDGHVDVALRGRSGAGAGWDPQVQTFLGSNLGTLTAAAPVSLGTAVTGLEFAHVTGSAALDGVGYAENQEMVLVFPVGGNGSLVAAQDGAWLSPVPCNSAPVVVDVNGDGNPDVVFSNLAGLTVLPGDGQGGLGAAVSTPMGMLDMLSPWHAQGGAADGLVAVDRGAGQVVFLTGSADASMRSTPLVSATDVLALVAGDVDGDGLEDVVVYHQESGELGILLGADGGAFLGEARVQGAAVDLNRTVALVVADADADGSKEIVLATAVGSTPTVTVVKKTATGFATHASTANAFVYTVALGDLDGDGRVDLATTHLNAHEVSLFRRTGSGEYVAAGSVPSFGFPPQQLALADVNGDGLTDVVVGAPLGAVTVIPGTAAGHGAPVRFLAPTHTTDERGTFVLADLNADHLPELLHWATWSGRLAVYLAHAP